MCVKLWRLSIYTSLDDFELNDVTDLMYNANATSEALAVKQLVWFQVSSFTSNKLWDIKQWLHYKVELQRQEIAMSACTTMQMHQNRKIMQKLYMHRRKFLNQPNQLKKRQGNCPQESAKALVMDHWKKTHTERQGSRIP